MNVRKNIDYSAMYACINDAMHSDLSMMGRYFAIGFAVAERPEKGAAVAAAEYIQKNWPNEKGYSPRNLRRMRELYRVYGKSPEAMALAEQIGWTQNIVILEAELDLQERLWYMRAVRQFGWSKLELIKMIDNAAHTEIVLDNGQDECDNEKIESNEYSTELTTPLKVVTYFFSKLSWMILRRCLGKTNIVWKRKPIELCLKSMEKRTAVMRC